MVKGACRQKYFADASGSQTSPPPDSCSWQALLFGHSAHLLEDLLQWLRWCWLEVDPMGQVSIAWPCLQCWHTQHLQHKTRPAGYVKGKRPRKLQHGHCTCSRHVKRNFLVSCCPARLPYTAAAGCVCISLCWQLAYLENTVQLVHVTVARKPWLAQQQFCKHAACSPHIHARAVVTAAHE